MHQVGLRATELGPKGFLPEDPPSLRGILGEHRLRLVGGFLPLVLHDPEHRRLALAKAEVSIRQLSAAGAEVLVLGAITGKPGYEAAGALDSRGWRHLVDTVAAVEDLAAQSGLVVTLHPHHGTMVETPEQTEHLLEASSVALCLDTGHCVVGGGDPVALAKEARGRIRHAHLKDVARDLAEQVRAGRLSYYDAVRAGMYRPLGEGDVEIATIVEVLEASRYRGWYVLEQDTVLDRDPLIGSGPVVDAARSVQFLESPSSQEGPNE
jgi:inosose dehydratase